MPTLSSPIFLASTTFEQSPLVTRPMSVWMTFSIEVVARIVGSDLPQLGMIKHSIYFYLFTVFGRAEMAQIMNFM